MAHTLASEISFSFLDALNDLSIFQKYFMNYYDF